MAVRTAAADEIAWADDWPKVRLIKLDIEGAELTALKGLKNLIERDRPLLTVEWNVSCSLAFGHHPRETHDLLENLGYRLIAPRDRQNRLAAVALPSDKAITMLWYAPRD